VSRTLTLKRLSFSVLLVCVKNDAEKILLRREQTPSDDSETRWFGRLLKSLDCNNILLIWQTTQVGSGRTTETFLRSSKRPWKTQTLKTKAGV